MTIKSLGSGVVWTIALALLLGGCRPTRTAGTPIAATIAAPTVAPTTAAASATPTLNAEAAPAALSALLPTVTPTPPVSPPRLPAPWQPATLRTGEPEKAIAADAILPSGETARATLFAVRAEGLDLHGYLRGISDELAAQTGITLLNARLDDTFREDYLPLARLDFAIRPAQGGPLAAIQIAYLEREHFIVVTVSAPEAAREELEAALRALYASITAE